MGELWVSIAVRDPDFLEVVFSEGEKYSQVNVLLLKQRKILGEADLFQELCQILQGREDRGHYRSKVKIALEAKTEGTRTHLWPSVGRWECSG